MTALQQALIMTALQQALVRTRPGRHLTVGQWLLPTGPLFDNVFQSDDILSVGNGIQLRGVPTRLVVTLQSVSAASSGSSCSSPDVELAPDNCHLVADVRLHQAVIGVMLPDLALADGLRQGHDMDTLAAVPLLLEHPQVPLLPRLLQQ